MWKLSLQQGAQGGYDRLVDSVRQEALAILFELAQVAFQPEADDGHSLSLVARPKDIARLDKSSNFWQ